MEMSCCIDARLDFDACHRRFPAEPRVSTRESVPEDWGTSCILIWFGELGEMGQVQDGGA